MLVATGRVPCFGGSSIIGLIIKKNSENFNEKNICNMFLKTV